MRQSMKSKTAYIFWREMHMQPLWADVSRKSNLNNFTHNVVSDNDKFVYDIAESPSRNCFLVRELKISILAYAHKSSAKIMRSKCSDTIVNSVVKRLYFCLETMFWSVLSVHEDRVYPDLLLALTMFWSAGFDQRAKELELSRPLHALCKQFVTLDSRRLGSVLIIVWYLKWGQN